MLTVRDYGRTRTSACRIAAWEGPVLSTMLSIGGSPAWSSPFKRTASMFDRDREEAEPKGLTWRPLVRVVPSRIRTRAHWHRSQIAHRFVQSRATGVTRLCERRLARALSPQEFYGSLAGEERRPVVVGGLVLLGHASKTRSGQQARGLLTHSDPENSHRKPSLFPSPETAQYCCAIQGQIHGGPTQMWAPDRREGILRSWGVVYECGSGGKGATLA